MSLMVKIKELYIRPIKWITQSICIRNKRVSFLRTLTSLQRKIHLDTMFIHLAPMQQQCFHRIITEQVGRPRGQIQIITLQSSIIEVIVTREIIQLWLLLLKISRFWRQSKDSISEEPETIITQLWSPRALIKVLM